MRLLLDESVPSSTPSSRSTRTFSTSNLTMLPVAVVLLDAGSVELKALLPLVPELDQALRSLPPKAFIRVSAGA